MRVAFTLMVAGCGRIGFDATVASDGAGSSGGEITTSFQDGVAPTSGYQGAADTWLQQSAPDMTFGTADACVVDGDDPFQSDMDNVALLRWDISAIPNGSVVIAAMIGIASESGSSDAFDMFEVTRAWNELEASWNNAITGVGWEMPGALGATDRAAPRIGTIPMDTPGALTLISLESAGIAMVQRWVDGLPNHGIVVANPANTNGLDFACRELDEVARRPKLVVTYR
jgi:hypothetical protein